MGILSARGAVNPDSIMTAKQVRVDLNHDGLPDLMEDTVTVSGRATVASGLLNEQFLQIFIQSGDAGLSLFRRSILEPVQPGDSIVARGIVGMYYGLTELKLESYRVIPSERKLPEPVKVNEALEDKEKYEGMLVTGQGTIINTGSNNNGKYLQVSLVQGRDETVVIYVSNFNARYGDFDFDRFNPGDEVRIRGILSQYNQNPVESSTYQVFPRTPSDLQLIGLPRSFFVKLLIAAAIIAAIVIGWVIALRSQVKKQTRKVREKEHQFSSVFRNAVDGICLFDRDLNIVDANPAASKILGSSYPELINGNLDDLIESSGRLRAIFETEPAFEFETIGYKRTGVAIDLSLKVSSIERQGEIHGMAQMRDVTREKAARKQLEESERRFRALTEESLVGVYMFKEGLFTYVNPKFADIFGFASADEIVHRLGPLDLTHPDDRHRVEEEARARMSGEKISSHYEFMGLKKNGEPVILEAFGTSIDYQGEMYVLGTVLDVTKRKEAEREIKRSLNEKETLLQEIHHRVKNNLAVISGLIELQLDSTLDAEGRKVLLDSQTRIQSMAMVHEKLYQSESLDRIEMDSYIRELIQTIQDTFYHSDADISLDLRLDSIHLSIDQAIPCGLLINELVVNVYKHAFKGREAGCMTVEFVRMEGGVQLVVADNGKGLPDDFDLNQSSSLGVSLIQTLTMQLGGEVDINSSSEGTRFTIGFALESSV